MLGNVDSWRELTHLIIQCDVRDLGGANTNSSCPSHLLLQHGWGVMHMERVWCGWGFGFCPYVDINREQKMELNAVWQRSSVAKDI